MRRGRAVSITGSKEADGVTFYRVTALPNNHGWVQAEAVAGDLETATTRDWQNSSNLPMVLNKSNAPRFFSKLSLIRLSDRRFFFCQAI
jgi:hypothetical protein